MRPRFAVAAVTAFASLALLIPAASAQGAWREDPFCSGDSNPFGSPVTLGPNRMCTSFPLNVNEFKVWWDVVTAGKGQVCLSLTYYGGSRHGQPISGIPGWTCHPLRYNGYANPTSAQPGDWWFHRWVIWAHNPYMRYSHRYGQARILNLSSATLRFHGQSSLGNWVTHWVQ